MSFLRKKFALFGVGLMFFIPMLWSQSDSSTSAKLQALQTQLNEMKAQMQKIEAQILEMSKPGTPPALGSAPAASVDSATTPTTQAASGGTEAVSSPGSLKRQVGEATATYQTDSEDPIAAPRPANAPLDPRYPGYFRLPGTDTLLRIGGFFKTDFIHDLKPAGDPDRFVPASFPIPAPVAVNNTTVSIRPTRMNLDFLVPVNDKNVRFFIEFDLFGTNATTARLRHAYAQAANFLVGQSFSNFMDPDAGPDTLDLQGPVSQVLSRNPQLRYTIPLAEKTTFSFSLEQASSDVSFSTPAFTALPNSPTPDGAITLRHEFANGHIQFSSLMRSPAAFLPNGKSDSVFGWGLSLSGAMKVFGNDTFVYQGAYGAGMERYINDISGLGIDAAPADANAPHLKAVPVVAPYGAYQHYWARQLRSSAVYGFTQVQNTDLQPGSTYHQANYTAANLIWNPIGSLNIGAEYLYGWKVLKSHASANAPRIMFSAKYSFIKTGPSK